MDQDTPEEKNSCAGELSLSLEKKKLIVISGEDLPQRDLFASSGVGV